MDFRHFKATLTNIACDKNISRLNTQMSSEDPECAPNVFMAQRWLSMQADLLPSVARCTYRTNKYLTSEQQMKMMLHCVSEVDYFEPKYIKK